jgi:hypothetical protein
MKDDIGMINMNIDNLKQTMITEFEAWLLDKYGEIPGHVQPDKTHEISRTTEGLDEEEDEDMDAIAYIKAKRNVSNLHKAKKQMLNIKHK